MCSKTSYFLLLYSLFWVLQMSACLDTYALSFQDDGYMNDDSDNVWAKLNTKLPELSTFSICTWVKFTYERIYNQIWSYCNEQGTGKLLVCSSLRFEPGMFVQNIAEQGFRQNTTGFREFLWNLVCGAYLAQGDRRMVTTIYFNGEKMFTKLHDTAKGLNKWFGAGEWYLGQDQDTLGGSFEKQQSLSGVLSNINIWSKIITDEEVRAMANCTAVPVGDIFNWNEADWELSNVKKIPMKSEEFCQDFPEKNYFMLPERRSLESGSEICNKLGGSISTPLDELENKKITKLGEDFYEVCEAKSQSGKTLWIGIEKNENSGGWQKIQNGNPVGFSNFREGQGGGSSNCVYLLTGSGRAGKWGAAQCSDQSPRRVCTLCEFSAKKTMFTLRGLCNNSRHDRKFTLENDGTSKPFFKGLSASTIRWDSNQSRWHLDHLRYTTEGFLNDETRKLYPIGRHNWTFDDRLCDINESPTMLTLTSCREDQFTCTDGTCQPLSHRCDLKADCQDRSDEEDCKKVIFPDDYEKALAPKHTIEGRRVDDPLPVYLSLDILSFDKIDTVNMMIAVMMRLNITWRDRRVDYLNLREDIYQNLIPDDESAGMWIPEIGFYNAKTGKLEWDDHYAMMVRRDSQAEPFALSRNREDYVYQGYKNSLMHLRRFYAEYHCTFNLRFFPFDEQVCKMEFKARTVTKQYLQLMPGKLKYRGPKVLVEFVVTNVTMGFGRDNVTRSEIRIVIRLARQYTYHLTQSFFQSFLMGLLAYLTFWIDISDFTDRFMGSLTALLVLAQLMSSLTKSLPKTSYYKVIDYWLLFFLLSTSLNIAVHVLVDKYYQSEQFKNLAKKATYLSPNATPKKEIQNMAELNRMEKFKQWKDGLTAQGINNFQKTLFPFIFLLFTLMFALHSYFRFGDIKPKDMDD